MTTLPRESARDVLHQSEMLGREHGDDDITSRPLSLTSTTHNNEEGSCRWLRVVGLYQTFKHAVIVTTNALLASELDSTLANSLRNFRHVS